MPTSKSYNNWVFGANKTVGSDVMYIDSYLDQSD